MTPERYRKVAELYERFPPNTRVDMNHPCKCAAGIIGSKISDHNVFAIGRDKILDILNPEDEERHIKMERVVEALQKIEYWHAGYMFGTTMRFYDGTREELSTTNTLAQFWHRIADKVEALNAHKAL